MGSDEGFLGQLGPALLELLPRLDERSRRLALGMAAAAAGEGGTGKVAALTGASWQTVADGRAELTSGDGAPEGRVRRPGGGRKRLEDADPGLAGAVDALVRDAMRGDPESPLLWTTRSLARMAGELTAAGRPCSPGGLRMVLRRAGYTLQSNSRAQEGRRHPERDAQFRYISAQAREHLDAGQPVISVDSKKREQIGNYRHDGREWAPKGEPVMVASHQFPGRDEQWAVPYGIYDEAANAGFVNVGTDGNTPALAAESIRRWRAMAGRDAYPDATRLLVTCDGGGPDSCTARAWKASLATLAQETGLDITVCHFPPGTSKWSKIEHRLFCHISLAWRARPLTSYDVIVSTIGAITTAAGLTATAVLDHNAYPLGQAPGDQEMRDIEDRCLTRHGFHGEWNYTLLSTPRPAPPPAPPAPPPARPGPDLHALASPQLTGISRDQLAALLATIEVPLAAAREERLYLERGRPRVQRPAGNRSQYTAEARLLTATCHYRLGMPTRALAVLFNMDKAHISRASREIAAILGTATPPLAPGPVQLRTISDLTAHAASHGITINGPPYEADTPPQATLATPDTPPT